MTAIPLNTATCTAVVLSQFDTGTKMLLMKRAKEGYWCQLAGNIEQNETACQAIVREVSEEISCQVKTLYSADFIVQFYEPELNRMMMSPAFVVFMESDVPIILNEEHTDYRWCTLDEAKALLPFPNQRTLFDHVWKNFVEQTPSEFMKVALD
ncbi:MAG: NUDIX domain-containing protein [Gammaproteobacteria bacterium]|nr:NUDIX domain-containing protein [Gammaproteobacteria bacterium]